MLTHVDWIFAAVLCAALPLYAAWSYPRFRRQAAAGKPDARVREYRGTMALEWGLVLALGLFWIAQERSLGALGLGLDTGIPFALAAGLATILVVLLILQSRRILRDPEQQASVREQLESLAELLPRTGRERAWFSALSITAGVCEEILYRGFLLWMLTDLTGLPLAVVLSSTAFGVAHLYQGSAGALRAAAVGLVMALLTVLSGSVWLAILVHAVIDLTSGRIATGSLRENPSQGAVAV